MTKQAGSLFHAGLLLVVLPFFSAVVANAGDTTGQVSQADWARQILEVTGVKGGLIVHVGCGDGKLTAALQASSSYLVQGLDTEAVNVARAREYVCGRGRYGPVCVDRFSGRSLPYAEGIVNLLVAEDLGDVPPAEVMRVLAPQGVAYLQADGHWTKTRKPRPEAMDDWTHYRYDSTGIAVSKDTLVGPPRRTQWVGSPRWARSHEHTASLQALVSSGGRIFYVIDEGSRASIQLPAKFVLAARDAFSGVVLWKRPLPHWFNHLFAFKSGPSRLTRRLVATGDEVYTTLGINGPLSAVDAATGKTIRTYPGTKTVEEVLASQGLLLLVVNPDRKPVDYQQEDANCQVEKMRANTRWGWDEGVDKLMAVDAATGKTVWQFDSKVVPLSLACDGQRVVYHDGEAVVCRQQGTGRQLWRTEVPRDRVITTGWSPSMVMYEDVILFSGKQRSLTGLSATDGKSLWTSKLQPSGHYCPEDVLVLDGLVWSGDIAYDPPWPEDAARRRPPLRSKGTFIGLDPHTGEVKREFPPDTNIFPIMHQRCYPSKATEKYLLTSWTGIEFIDPRAKTWQIHHWVRGGCLYGIMPANGLIYATPHACACYYQSKLNGFWAVAPEREPTQEPGKPAAGQTDDGHRFQRGPAFREAGAESVAPAASDVPATAAQGSSLVGDWPTWRGDNFRSGSTKTPVSPELRQAWRAQIGGPLSSVTVADGRLFVARIHQHTVCALDADSGKTVWSFTAGGRVDSPPTYYEGRVLFGSADGCVYCLRASDGVLVWRFRAAPADRRVVAFEQVESIWPLHGSVLIQDGVAFCLAGRSMFLDGGMRLVRLDAKSGRKLSETVLDDRDPATGENLQSRIDFKKMPVTLPDVLTSDGEYVYMRSQRFDLEGRRVTVLPELETDQQGNHHLFSPVGLLDDSWFHRAYWIYGKNAGEGWAQWFLPGRLVPSGRILCLDDDTVYAYGRHPWYLCNSSVLEYRLYAADRKGDETVDEATRDKIIGGRRSRHIPRDSFDWKSRSGFPDSVLTQVPFKWIQEQPPLMARAMVVAAGTLFVAGPPDVDDEHAGWGRHLDNQVAARHAEQMAALEGKKGGLLWAVSAADGRKQAEYPLASPPVFDGMVAANGRLYVAAMDGSIVCFSDATLGQ